MATLTLQTEQTTAQLEITPHQKWITCIMPSLMKALQCFIEAYIQCITEPQPPGGYNPGGPRRCG